MRILRLSAIVVSIIVMFIFVCLFVDAIYLDVTRTSKHRNIVGIDFGVYYTAGRMTLSGDINNIYNRPQHHANLEKVLNREVAGFLPWVYPPTFLLMVIHFAHLPYYYALITWVVLTFALAVFAAYLLIPKHKEIAFLICGFPGIVWNLYWGQNAFLNTALIGLGLHFMEGNPVLSGFMFGLLTYKPQLAFFPLVLLFLTKNWKVLSWSIVFSLLLSLFCVGLFGFDIWLSFFDAFFESSSLYLSSAWKGSRNIQPTLYSSLRLLGLNGSIAMALHAFVAIAVTFFSVWVWKKTDRFALRGSILVVGIFLTMPYFLQYDLMVLAIPFMLLYYDCLEYGSYMHEKVLIGFLWLMSLINWPVAQKYGLQLCPFVLIVILAMLIARVKEEQLAVNINNEA